MDEQLENIFSSRVIFGPRNVSLKKNNCYVSNFHDENSRPFDTLMIFDVFMHSRIITMTDAFPKG